MYVQSIGGCSFGCNKNTYLRQAQKSIEKGDKREFLSYHYEAASRLHGRRAKNIAASLKGLPKGSGIDNILNGTKILLNVVREKSIDIYCYTWACMLCPERF